MRNTINILRKTIPYCFFILILSHPQNSWGREKLQYNIDVSAESLNYLLNRADHSINDQINLEGIFGLNYDNNKNFLFNLQPRIRVDVLDSDRNRYLPNEAYFKFYNKSWEFTSGFQLVSWGVSRSFNPTDVINRPDLEGNYYRPAKLGDPISSLKLSIPQAGAFSQLSLEALVVPIFLETPLPKSDTRFAIENTIGGVSFTNNDDQEKPTYPNAMGFGFRAAATYKATDISLHYYHGPERTPSFFIFLDQSLNVKSQPFYYIIDMVGLNVESVISHFTLHLETAMKFTRFNEPRFHQIPFTDTSDVIPNDYLQFVPGIDYTVDGLFGTGTLIITAEYVGENNHNHIFEEFRPLKNDAFLGARLMLNDLRMTQFDVGASKDLGNAEMVVLLEASTKIYKELKLTVGGIIVNQDSDPNQPLSFFDNNTQVYSRLSYSLGGSLLKDKEKKVKVERQSVVPIPPPPQTYSTPMNIQAPLQDEAGRRPF